jgi:hypothetical protein
MKKLKLGLKHGLWWSVGFVLVCAIAAQISNVSTFAQLPAGNLGGRLLLFTDSMFLLRDNGKSATYQAFGPVYPFTVPPASGWTWVNQGGATITQTNGTLFMTAPATGTDNLRLYLLSLPSTPFTRSIPLFAIFHRNSSPSAGGLAFYESGTGKVVTLELVSSGSYTPYGFEVDTWNSPTSYNSTLASASIVTIGGPQWLRVSDDGANLAAYLSSDGINWRSVWSAAITSVFTTAPDHVGIVMGIYNSGYTDFMTVPSWGN